MIMDQERIWIPLPLEELKLIIRRMAQDELDRLIEEDPSFLQYLDAKDVDDDTVDTTERDERLIREVFEYIAELQKSGQDWLEGY